MSGHDSGVHVGGNDHSACEAQTAEERNLPEIVNGRVVCHHLVRLQTQTFTIAVCVCVCQEITRNSTEHSQRCLGDSPAAVVLAEMSGHDSGVDVGGNDHSAFAAQTAEGRNLQEFVNSRVVCHHLVCLPTPGSLGILEGLSEPLGTLKVCRCGCV